MTKKFNLREPDTYFKYWSYFNTINQTINGDEFNGDGVMVQVCVILNGAISMVEILKKKYDAKKICPLVEDKVLPLTPL